MDCLRKVTILQLVKDTYTMQAIVQRKFGSPNVLELAEIEQPRPKDREVLIRNYGSSINTGDILYRSGKAPKAIFSPMRQITTPFLRIGLTGIRKPRMRVPGLGFVGEIVAVGEEITDWKIGDQVYGFSETGGAYAKYLCVPSDILAKKPKNLTFQEAAAVPGGSTPALIAFRDLATPKEGDKVLIIGASGGIGTFAVQMAKNVYGAEVTGVCGPTNMDMVKSIGADFVIDYAKEDYTKGEIKYDIIFDTIGASNLSKCKNILTETGVFVSNNPVTNPRSLFHMITGIKRLKSGTADESATAMEQIRQWIEEGKIVPVIDTVYPLSKVSEAHRHYETGHAKGRIVIGIE